MSGRCKGCNAILQENEIKWRQDLKQHEDLCLKCRQASSINGFSEDDLTVLDKLEEEGL